MVLAFERLEKLVLSIDEIIMLGHQNYKAFM